MLLAYWAPSSHTHFVEVDRDHCPRRPDPVLVLGLLLYAISARDPLAPPYLFDHCSCCWCSRLDGRRAHAGCDLIRITEFGASPNKIAAPG